MRTCTRLLLLAGLVVGLLAPGTAALADPAGPTNYRSTVTGADLALDGVDVRVMGGDSFLVIEVEPGHEAIVYGYRFDPTAPPGEQIDDRYLRVDADGRVFVNVRSPAYYLNQGRYTGTSDEARQLADPEAPPEWQQVADGGVYAWHDHRIHWMSPEPPPAVRRDPVEQDVLNWTVPIAVDGEPVQVEGVLRWSPSSTPLVWLAVAVFVAAAIGAASRRLPLVAVAAGTGVGALISLGVGLVAVLDSPPGAETNLLIVLLPAIGVLGLLAALGLRSRGTRTATGVAGVAALPVLAWSLSQFGALTRPYVPYDLADSVVRAAVAVALGLSLGALLSVALTAFGREASAASGQRLRRR